PRPRAERVPDVAQRRPRPNERGVERARGRGPPPREATDAARRGGPEGPVRRRAHGRKSPRGLRPIALDDGLPARAARPLRREPLSPRDRRLRDEENGGAESVRGRV